jgi:FMN phosphatase YigB (HAD superfamily)
MPSAPEAQPTPQVERSRCSVLITDLDNTLWDWFKIWHASFSALLREVVRASGVPQEILEQEIREVHQRRHTSEYAFLLQELPSLQRLHPGQDIPAIYDGAIHAHRRARQETVEPYPGVRETLLEIRNAGALIIGHTESMAFYTADRLRRTGLDEVLDLLYSAPDHDLPAGASPEQLRTLPAEHYELRRTVHRHTPRGVLKPDPTLLRTIMQDIDAVPSEVAYVGDSLMKDIAMALSAKIVAVWAKYGESHRREGYELLRRVSHWTPEDVEREKRFGHQDATPTYEIESFDALLSLFAFQPRATPRPPPVQP